MDNGGILIFEDDPGTRELEAQRLKPLGMAIRKAACEAEAAAALKDSLPELMLLDYSLPGGSALEFIEELKRAGAPVPPFMVVTGRGDETVAVAAMKAGACDYLVKNNDFLDSLLPAVRKALEKIALLRELETAQRSTARNLHLYTFLAQVNLAATQTRDREGLFRRICEVAVTAGGLRMAWIGLLDTDLGRIIPDCWAGTVDGYLEGLRIDIQHPGTGDPTGGAASLRKIQACADIKAEPTMAPWRDKALARGYRSAAAIPLEENGRLAGALTIYSEEAGFFSGAELKLLEEIRADITLALDAIASEEKRVAAQAALERTSSQLAHIMDVTPIILFTLKPAASGALALDWVSGNAGALTGYTPEEMFAPGWWMENIHPDDKQAATRDQSNIFERGITQDFRFRRKDGSYFWLHAQLTPSGGGREVTGSWTDITQLKESETRFQELFEKTPVGYQSLDERGRLLAVSDTWCKVFGFTREEAIGRPLTDFLAPGQAGTFAERFEKFKRAGAQENLELEILRADGSRRLLSYSGKVARNADGGFRQTYCVFTDITESREQNKRMRLLNDAVSASFDEVYIFDPQDFHFIFVNQSAFMNLGYSAAELQRLRPWDIKHGFTEASFKAAVAPLLRKEQHMLLLEDRHTRKDGSSYPVELRLQLVENNDERFFLAVANDLTERKNSERMMAELSNMQRVESLGALAGGIAHDFNNMLTGIMANLSLLSARCGAGENADIIRDTLEAARSAQALTTHLLAFAKGGKPVKKEFCLEQALRDIFTLATRGTRAAHDLRLAEGLWSVEGDEGQLKQAINNLLVNALQAMPAGGTLNLTAENTGLSGGESPLPPGKYVRVAVSDTGIGIPKEYLERVFEPYFTTKTQGHGLGLSMTWSVVKNHGGHISALSDPGKGSRFEVLLPATGRTMKTERAPGREIVKGGGRVLMLEDEDIVVRAARRMMSELGYDCEVSGDGAETLARYAAEKTAGRPFDAVIMDLTIPGGMGGKEAGAELRRRYPEAVIIVSSGYSDEPVMADYKAFGFDAVLPKPYRYEDLAETLARLVRKK
ncbi:MAG: PAS domain S-box protein [Elusimicrobiales bacterium]